MGPGYSHPQAHSMFLDPLPPPPARFPKSWLMTKQGWVHGDPISFYPASVGHFASLSVLHTCLSRADPRLQAWRQSSNRCFLGWFSAEMAALAWGPLSHPPPNYPTLGSLILPAGTSAILRGNGNLLVKGGWLHQDAEQ